MRKKLHLHDLSEEKLLSGNMGWLMPTHFRMVYPGDIVQQRTTHFIRVSPMLSPIMSKVLIKCESFYVAADNVWDNAQAFFSRGQDGTNTNTIPKRTLIGPSGLNSVLDYLGVYKTGVSSQDFNVLPARCYQEIYKWHYMDLDLQTPPTVSKANGPDTTTSLDLQFRCWERDRFTTARLEPQRGDDVLIPQADASAPVTGIGALAGQSASGTDRTVWETDKATGTTFSDNWGTNTGDIVMKAEATGVPGAANTPQIYANIDGTEIAGTIRELEEAVAINRFRKRLQQADGSYPDYTLATFGVRAPDIELQKPVLLARSSSPLQISEVLQTAQQYDDMGEPVGTPVGEMRGHGIAVARGHSFRYKVKRHGYIMTILSVVPKSLYVGGTDREFFRTVADDYFDPDLDEIGEEPIENQEVDTNHTDPTGTFGYQYRNYCDRSSLNSVAGEFRTSILNYWHQGRDVGNTAALNSDFVTCEPTDRIFSYGSEINQLRIKAMHDIKMLRVMRRIPKRGIL